MSNHVNGPAIFNKKCITITNKTSKHLKTPKEGTIASMLTPVLLSISYVQVVLHKC